MTDVLPRPVPAVHFLRFDERGEPFLVGSRCQDCGAVTAGERIACPCCTARDRMESIRLGERGTVYTYTIVHRSFPGVKTPFVAVVVDLHGGGSIKGTLLDVAPDPAAVAYDMPVDVVFRDSGQRNADGQPFIAYYFVRSKGAA